MKRPSAWPVEISTDGRVRPRRPAHRPRGRPSKFGRPGRVVALTLPEDTIRGLRRVDPDIGWAIVKLLEGEPGAPRAPRELPPPDVELVTVGVRRSLVVVNMAVFKSLPGVHIIPLTGTRAFLALDLGRGMSDLELAVIDRLSDRTVNARERRALVELRTQLTAWRRDHGLQFHPRAIIVVERLPRSAGDGVRRAGRP